MNVDEYGEVINGKDTYFEIAKHLMKGESVGIGWTDEDSTHFDIIFTLFSSYFSNSAYTTYL